ncbi:hypothetical protein PFFVO_06016, partial [Plasmodium falciparum Vietnam Oak-Knoll (FVO)]
MATSGGSGGTQDEDAKHVLDEFGQKVHDEVHGEAKNYVSELKGSLSLASILGETAFTENPCKLESKYTELIEANSKRNPCKKDGKGNDVDRFSVKEQAEYDNKKMKCSNGDACAPFRRLHLCNKNFPNMNSNDSSKAKHDLLAEVCMAAKYEGESIKTHYPKYDSKYPGSDFPMCTMLARSFADIGDIIRGRDLYLGNKKKKQNGKETEREKLEQKLKEIFKKIHDNLKDKEAQKRYNGDEDPNFYKLREDWWTANRETVWEAMTCSKELDNSSYFRATCNDTGQGPSQTHNKCRCDKDKGANAGKPKAGDGDVTIVPTYFDYVPQYLRWFEEWAEDFCRKKKKKLENAKNKCRGPSGTDKYCSLNGCDCTKTVRARGKLRYGNRCIDCLYACNPYVHWIDKKKEEFDKQKNKYEKEMQKYENGASSSSGSGSGRQRRGVRSNNNYEGYEKIFYEKLEESGYKDVGKFLDLLSEEKTCKDITDDKEGIIDFNEHVDKDKEYKGTFYHSEYCQPCPYCGMKKKDPGKGWEKKSETDKCNSGNLYKPTSGAIHTPINFLYSGDKRQDIEKKLEAFCKTQNGTGGVANGSGSGTSGSKELYQYWKCYEGKDVEIDVKDEDHDEEDYQNVINAGGLCILKKEEQSEKKIESEGNSQNNHADIQKTFNDFFNFWVAHMLKDSIYWRTKKIKGCLENGTKKCGKNCKDNCGCFEKWVKQKKDEWTNIKKHFYTQKDICKKTNFMVINHHYVLKTILEDEFLKDESTDNSEENSKNSLDEEEAEELKHIRKIIKKKNQEEADDGVGVVPTCGE